MRGAQKPEAMGTFSPADPYASARNSTEPTEEEKNAAEEALRISKAIDQNLLETRQKLEKKKKTAQILLLGQSESGKSSVLRNFLMTFAPQHFQKERPAWKTIIQLNLIGGIKVILELLKGELESSGADNQPAFLDRDLRRIQLGLSPLLSIEANMIRILSGGAGEKFRDLCVQPGSDWKSLLGSRCSAASLAEGGGKRQSHRLASKELDLTSVLAASKEDVLRLWNNPGVRELLKRRNIRMEEMPGFFLNDVERIVDANYEPTNNDILRARIRTLGVEEHHFVIEKGSDVGSEVYITDVGGCRSHRASWIPYFEHVQSILFLAPLSFNRHLDEDPRVNRIEDSLTIWREICANKLLANATILLFFNKKDILVATLAAGIKVKKYVPSYGDAPNEVAFVTKYFCDKFRSYHRKLSPVPRPFMFYETSAVESTSMEALLCGVRETILRINLKQGHIF